MTGFGTRFRNRSASQLGLIGDVCIYEYNTYGSLPGRNPPAPGQWPRAPAVAWIPVPTRTVAQIRHRLSLSFSLLSHEPGELHSPGRMARGSPRQRLDWQPTGRLDPVAATVLLSIHNTPESKPAASRPPFEISLTGRTGRTGRTGKIARDKEHVTTTSHKPAT